MCTPQPQDKHLVMTEIQEFNDLLNLLDVDARSLLVEDEDQHKENLLRLLRQTKSKPHYDHILLKAQKTKLLRFKTGPNRGEWTLLHFAISTAKRFEPQKRRRAIRNITILSKFLNIAAVSNLSSFGSALHYACDLGEYEIVQIILNHTNPTDIPNILNSQFKISSEAKNNQGANYCHTPLTIALLNGIHQPESCGEGLIDLLLRIHKADANTECEDRFTPILWLVDSLQKSETHAQMKVCLDCLELILEYGGDPRKGSVEGVSCIQYLVETIFIDSTDVNTSSMTISANNEAVDYLLAKHATKCPIQVFKDDIVPHCHAFMGTPLKNNALEFYCKAFKEENETLMGYINEWIDAHPTPVVAEGVEIQDEEATLKRKQPQNKKSGKKLKRSSSSLSSLSSSSSSSSEP